MFLCVSLLIQPIESGWVAVVNKFTVSTLWNLSKEALRAPGKLQKREGPILCVKFFFIISQDWEDDVFIFYIEMHFVLCFAMFLVGHLICCDCNDPRIFSIFAWFLQNHTAQLSCEFPPMSDPANRECSQNFDSQSYE